MQKVIQSDGQKLVQPVMQVKKDEKVDVAYMNNFSLQQHGLGGNQTGANNQANISERVYQQYLQMAKQQNIPFDMNQLN